MDAASWSASLPLIIAFGLGILGLWFAIRIAVDKTIAELKTDIRAVNRKLDAMSARKPKTDPTADA